MTKTWSSEIQKVIFTHVLLIGLPAIFYGYLLLSGWSLVAPRVVVLTLFLGNAVMIIFESSNALFRRFAAHRRQSSRPSERSLSQVKAWMGVRGAEYPHPLEPLPRCSFLVAAYLPNEQGLIVETLNHLLAHIERPAGGLEIILAYNTPVDLPIEAELQQLARQHTELTILRVEGSRSKAENINAALDIATGEIACVLDADHHPSADCFRRAWHWIAQGYDVVQGRNIIRNYDENFLVQNVAIEFEQLYGISHAAKSFLTDSSIFGGSNGYWRTSVLKQIRFNPARLTEDIDASLRTLLNGYKILHDRSIVTSELAPASLKTFWFQRKRWAHGWLEVSLLYQRRMWRSPHFNIWQKFYWTYLLYYCESFALISLQLLPVLLAFLLVPGAVSGQMRTYFLIAGGLSLFSGIYQIVAAAKVASRRYPLAYYLKHVLFLPFYVTLKNSIAIVAIYDYLNGENTWVVTPRDTQAQKRYRLKQG
ncbi:glycosyltransferase family 2 protein [Leptolyngbya sp. CCNP1308]|uniref:glycosyltransferase n=1 Tax=Leptolyngbya sp. CCNP1308 TaxID=3110255 RepID=UPI002B204610|nr:glycosyltransferase family 2 protein [Leptolyngbya sp. CCNP1308]MEA5446995.1 glycosyltransferase family 2 protein [Leptolyngbya sp. CCNP1308]